MAILRCAKCGHLREVPNEYIGRSVACPSCQNNVTIYATVAFLQQVLRQYTALRAELAQLKTPAVAGSAPAQATASPNPLIPPEYAPVIQWFKHKQITANLDLSAVDTSGFFDEIALQLGDNYSLFSAISDKIFRTQHGGYTNLTLKLADYSQKDAQMIHDFCKMLYDHSFVSKFFYKNIEKRIHLTLQTAPQIVNFFNGIWLEWYVFMKLRMNFETRAIPFAGVRSLELIFSNEDKHELDCFFLLRNQHAICIECKSGEFRQQIEKYQKLRQRLGLNKEAFWMVVMGLTDVQAQGLSAMYSLTFVNEANFMQLVDKLV